MEREIRVKRLSSKKPNMFLFLGIVSFCFGLAAVIATLVQDSQYPMAGHQHRIARRLSKLDDESSLSSMLENIEDLEPTYDSASEENNYIPSSVDYGSEL